MSHTSSLWEFTASIGAFLSRGETGAALLDFTLFRDRVVDPFLLWSAHISAGKERRLRDVAWVCFEQVHFRADEHAVYLAERHLLDAVAWVDEHAPAVFVRALQRRPEPTCVAVRQLVLVEAFLRFHCHPARSLKVKIFKNFLPNFVAARILWFSSSLLVACLPPDRRQPERAEREASDQRSRVYVLIAQLRQTTNFQ